MNEEPKEIKPEIDKKEAEPTALPVTQLSAKEILGSLELTVAFLDDLPDQWTSRNRESHRLTQAFIHSSQPEIDALAQEQEASYVDLIQKGLEGFLEAKGTILADDTFSEREKQRRVQELQAMYQRAQQLRQMARAQALDRILVNFLNPYLWTTEGSRTYNYDQGFETATTLVDATSGTYKSRWDPRVHFDKELGHFLSPKDVNEMRKFIEGFFGKHEKVIELLSKVRKKLGREIDDRGYDPTAAEHILSVLGKLPEGHSLNAHTRVVISPNSITIVLSDTDYDRIVVAREKRFLSSGGVHHTGTVLNLARDSYRTDKIISHENEHALNDELLGLHTMDLAETATGLITSLETQKEYSEQELANIAEQLIRSMFKVQFGSSFYMSRFADEVLAYKLGNKDRSNQEILDTLNNDKLYDYINLTEGNMASQLALIVRGIHDCLFGYRSRFSSNPGIMQTMDGRPAIFSSQIVRFLSGKDYSFIEGAMKKLFNPDTVYAMRQTAIEQVDRLMRAGHSPEMIRALLSASNPLQWKEITSLALGNPDIIKKEKRAEEDKSGIRALFRDQAQTALIRAGKISADSEEFLHYQPLSEAEKQYFTKELDMVAKLTTHGYTTLQDGLKQYLNYKNYKCVLRKLQGEQGCRIIIHSSIEEDPASGNQNIETSVQINVVNGQRTAEKIFVSENDEQFTFEHITALIAEAEKEVGIKTITY